MATALRLDLTEVCEALCDQCVISDLWLRNLYNQKDRRYVFAKFGKCDYREE